MSFNLSPINLRELVFFEEAPRVLNAERPSIHVQDENGETPLIRAVKKGDWARAEWLIHAKANIETSDRRGGTPLQRALLASHFDIAKRLFDLGASIPPVLWATWARTHQFTLIEKLLEWGADPNLPTYHNPLCIAARQNHPDLVQLLLRHKADPHCVVDNSTPLLHVYISNIPSLEPFRALEEADAGFTDHLIAVRLAGHRFALQGSFYNNLGPRITFPSFAYSLNECAEEKGPSHALDLEITAASLSQAVNRSLQAKDYLLDWQQGKIVTLKTGMTRHTIALVLFQRWLAMGNCGFGAEEEGQSGLHFYTIGSDAWMEQVIDSLLQLGEIGDRHRAFIAKARLSPEEFQEFLQNAKRREILFFQRDIHSFLELTPLHSIPFNRQITGNCGFVAAKLSSLAILTFLHFYEERSMKEAADLAYPIYDAVVRKDCERAMHELFSLETKVPRLKESLSFDELFTLIKDAWTSSHFRDTYSEESQSTWHTLRELYAQKIFQRDEEIVARLLSQEDASDVEEVKE